MAIEVLYVSNDNLLTVDELYDVVGAAYLNAATVTVTLVDSSGSEVTGQSWPTTLAYVASSNGKYRAVLEDGLGLTAGQPYTAKVTADGGADKKGYWEVPCRAITRTE